MDLTGAKLCALAQSRCSMSLRLKSFSQSGSGAVMTTSHSSVMDVGDAFALDEPGHGLLPFLAGLAHRGPPAHDPPVETEPDPAAGHVQAVRVQHEVQRALGPDRAVVGGVPAHQDLVVPQPQLAAPVVAALFLAQPPGDGGDLEQFAFLLDLDLLGGDLLVSAARGLPGRPPLAAQLDLVRGLACQLGYRDAQGIGDGDGY